MDKRRREEPQSPAAAREVQSRSRLMELPPHRHVASSQTSSAAATRGKGTRNITIAPVASQDASLASSTTPVASPDPSSERTVPSDVPTSASGIEPSQPTGQPDDVVAHVDSDTEEGEGGPPAKRMKKTTSGVWQYFNKYWVTVKVNGKEEKQLWAECNFSGCKNKTSKARAESCYGTTGFWTHLKNYHSIVKGQQQLATETDKETGLAIVKPFKYDQEASVQKFYKAMIVHEYPFNMVEHEYFQDWVKSMRPYYPLKCRVTVRKELMDLYLAEKEKLYEYFKTLKCRFSATMDMWTSNQNKTYMCVTLHWIDADWKIQKRIVNFFKVSGRHTGEHLAYTVNSCLLKWYVERKMFSLTLDNASANEVAVKDLVKELKKHSTLICDGLFFHVRCANHIMNLVVKDGMRVINSAVVKIRAFVLAIKGSTQQWEEFLKCATECGLNTSTALSLDVATRWNSTFSMLKDALYYQATFERLSATERQKYGHLAPSPEDWGKARTLIPFLRKFFDLTEIFSGTLYPTANLFFRGFCEIRIMLHDWRHHSDPIISEMAEAMIVKFDKYWKKSNLALAVASVLDPRFKRRVVEFYLLKFYANTYQAEIEKFNAVLRKIYQCYVSATPASKSTAPSSEPVDQFVHSVDAQLDSYLDEGSDPYAFGDEDQPNELEKYLTDKLEKKCPKGVEFNILAWWRKEGEEDYPTLARLARDVLAMQVSTVASESAFSAGGRVIDPFRSRLDPEMVEALVCAKDWITAADKANKNISSIAGDLEIMEAIKDNLRIEDEISQELGEGDDDVAYAYDDMPDIYL